MSDRIVSVVRQPPTTVTVVAPLPTTTVVVGQQGPAGAPGVSPQGSDYHYPHSQMVPAAVWTINHNLGKFPAVQVFDSSGDEVEGLIHHNNSNTVTVTFSAPFSGVAYLN